LQEEFAFVEEDEQSQPQIPQMSAD
jgi:hypothetical protein